jgi:uncharacterized membrane protein YjgN (DUF898 family)
MIPWLGSRGTLSFTVVTFVSIPLILLSLGLLAPAVSWIWLKWEQSNLLIPDKSGSLRETRFHATVGEYFGQLFVGQILILVTFGFYRPWAKVEEWRWIATRTHID